MRYYSDTRRAPTKDLAAVAVTDSAAVNLDATGDGDNLSVGCTVFNDGPNTAYIGGSEVTSARGFPVAALGSFDLLALPSLTWARCATGQTASLRVIGA